MTKEQLKQANALNKKIKECEQALNCFEYIYTDCEGKNPQTHDRTPRLIIDTDDLDSGREQIALPFNLSNALIDFLKQEIRKSKVEAEEQFKSI